MRILIVSDAWVPQVNGVVRTLRMTRSELEKRGHEVFVISPSDFRSIPCPTYPEIRLALCFSWQMARRIDEINPDCLHIATEGPLGWAARKVAKRRHWPFTTAYHSRFPEYVEARFGVPVAWVYSILRRFHGAAKRTLVPTESIRAELARRRFLNVQLWSRGVDLQLFSAEGETEERRRSPVFLYVGRIAIEKRVDKFLDLDLPGEKWVVGDGPERARLEKRYPEARWLGGRHGDQLAKMYRSADVMVFPSVTDTFGLVIIESMACGTPVAAYPVAGPIDVIGQSKGGVMHEDLAVASIQALKLDRASARERAEQFSWSHATDQIESAFCQIPRVEPAVVTRKSYSSAR